MKKILFYTMIIMLSGCIHDRSDDYLMSRNRPDFKIPTGMSTQAISKNYYLPNAQQAEAVSIYPPQS